MCNRILIVALALVMVLGFTQANVAKAQVVMDGLVSYWTFDEADIDGDILEDVVGSNDGTINGGPTTVPGKINEALYFDSKDDNIDCGTDDSLKMDEGLTIECWVYWEGGYSPIAGIEGSYKIMVSESGGLYLNLATASHAWAGWMPKYNLVQDEWHHLAMVYDGSNLIFYADGVKLGEDPAKGAVTPKGNPFRIGVYCVPPHPHAERVFCGKIDELRVYNRGLSEEEIQHNMEASFYDLAVAGPDGKLAGTWGNIKASK